VSWRYVIPRGWAGGCRVVLVVSRRGVTDIWVPLINVWSLHVCSLRWRWWAFVPQIAAVIGPVAVIGAATAVAWARIIHPWLLSIIPGHALVSSCWTEDLYTLYRIVLRTRDVRG